MKSPLLLLAALACASSLFAQNSSSFNWDFTRAFSIGSSVEVPESSGGPAISFRDGASLAVDPDEQGRQVLVLGGLQTDWGRTKRDVDPFDSITMRARFKPAELGAPLQTVLSAGASYELRYNRGRERLEFIVNLPERKYHLIFVEAGAGIWNQAVATYKDGRMVLTVGLSRASSTIPDGLLPVSISTTVRVGLIGQRPFSGSISEISVSSN